MNALAVSEDEVMQPRLPLEPDLFGQVIMDHYQGHPGEFYLRRDDNYVERDSSARYFQTWEQMPAHQRCLLNHASGRVLDIGAGSGCHTLVLQERGIAVTAIDASPLAIEVCRQRGVQDARVMNAHALHFDSETFDSVLLLGNNLGIAGTPEGLHGLLARLHGLVNPGGQILADVVDYTATCNVTHLRYHRRNLAHGRYPGTIGMRVEYRGKCGPHFDWLLMKLADLRAACAATGWRIGRCVQVNADAATFAIGMMRE
jgi:SAM-dependent methyltransferase